MTALLCLAACRNPSSEYFRNPSFSQLPVKQRHLLMQIEKSGIQVIKQGMRFTFVIPIDAYFSRWTHEIKRHQENNLMQLAYFIEDYKHAFRHLRVTVTGYSDTVYYAPARDKRSQRDAQLIADALRENGVLIGRIHVKGMGAREPVGDNSYPMGASFNRRVEVIVDAER